MQVVPTHSKSNKIRSLYVLELWSYYQEGYVTAHIFCEVFWRLRFNANFEHIACSSIYFSPIYMPFSSLTVRYLTDGRVSLKAYNHKNSRFFFFSFQHNLTKLFTGKNINVWRSLQSSIWQKRRRRESCIIEKWGWLLSTMIFTTKF